RSSVAAPRTIPKQRLPSLARPRSRCRTPLFFPCSRPVSYNTHRGRRRACHRRQWRITSLAPSAVTLHRDTSVPLLERTASCYANHYHLPAPPLPSYDRGAGRNGFHSQGPQRSPQARQARGGAGAGDGSARNTLDVTFRPSTTYSSYSPWAALLSLKFQSSAPVLSRNTCHRTY